MSENLAAFGGVSTLLIGVAICSSLAMVLPISTPPNALADATGFIKQKYMVTTGLILGLIGLLLGYLVLIFCGINGCSKPTITIQNKKRGCKASFYVCMELMV